MARRSAVLETLERAIVKAAMGYLGDEDEI